MKNILKIIILLTILADVLNVTFPLWLSVLVTMLLGVDYFRKASHLYGLINISTFFIVLFLTGVITLLPKSFDEQYVIGAHSTWFQSIDLFEKVAQICLQAFASIYLGWLMFGFRNGRVKVKDYSKYSNLLFTLSALLAFFFSYIGKPDATILTTTYTEITHSFNKGLNASMGFALFSTVMTFYNYLTKPNYQKMIVFIILFVFSFIYCGFLAGGRVEQLGCLAAMVVAYQWIKNVQISKKVIYISATFLIVLFVIIGYVRSSIGGNSGNKPFQILNTQKDAMTTALITLGLENEGSLNMDYGQTMLDVLISILPSAVDSDRPEIFNNKLSRLTQSNGGNFVINEPYISGHFVAIVSIFFSVGLFFKKMENINKNLFGSILYLGIVSALPRFVYYGWLPAYRFLQIAFLFYLIYFFVIELNPKNTRSTI